MGGLGSGRGRGRAMEAESRCHSATNMFMNKGLTGVACPRLMCMNAVYAFQVPTDLLHDHAPPVLLLAVCTTLYCCKNVLGQNFPSFRFARSKLTRTATGQDWLSEEACSSTAANTKLVALTSD